jgi:hypothetical protein
MEMLRTYGCDFAQGHLIAPPMDAEQLTSWLKAYELGGARPSRTPKLRAVEGTQG